MVNGQRKRVRVCKQTPLPQAASVTATIGLGTSLQGIAVSDDAVWVLSHDRRLFRIDPATNRVAATIPLPDSEWPEGQVLVADGSIWVTVASPDTDFHPEFDSVLRIDPLTNQVLARIHVGHSPMGMTSTPGALWVANHRSEYTATGGEVTGVYDVSRVDQATNLETGRVQIENRQYSNGCCGPWPTTAAAGSVWVGDQNEDGHGFVIRLNPATSAVEARISFAKSKATIGDDVVGDETAIWLVSDGSPYLTRIDPRTNRVVATVKTGEDTVDLTLGLGFLWVTTAQPLSPGALIRINPGTNKVVARTRIQSAGAVAVGEGSLWVASGTKLLRMKPRPRREARDAARDEEAFG